LPVDTTKKVAAIVSNPDSVRVADSVRKARREAQKKAALAQAESVRNAQENKVKEGAANRAREAAFAMLSNASAAKLFNDGATHKGGVLGSKRKGDLQTQINALVPFLTQSGVTYAQFKDLVKAAGIELFDEYGRMLPAALKQFANSH
jgi:hypothetical protein